MSADRAVTGSLKAVGLRDLALSAVLERRRRARLEAEARGSDELSHPALYEMDRKLDALLDMDGGFFVEAGANDGFTQSNTYWLERFRGWRGLLVEPMPELHELCVTERAESIVRQAGLVPRDFGEETVRMRFGDLMSSVVGETMDEERTAAGVVQGWRDSYETEVPAATLSELLEEVDAPEVDLLSLDVEGFEPQVLAGLDLDRHAPRWILVEVHDFETGRPPIENLIGDHFELHGPLSPVDLLYRRRDVAVAV